MFCFGIEFHGKTIAFKKFSDPNALHAFLDPTATGVFGEDGIKFRKTVQDMTALAQPDWHDTDQIVGNVASQSEETDFDIEFEERADRSIGVEDFTYWVEPKDQVDNPPRAKRSATR